MLHGVTNPVAASVSSYRWLALMLILLSLGPLGLGEYELSFTFLVTQRKT